MSDCTCDRTVGENCPDCYVPGFDRSDPVAQAKSELETFERVSRKTADALLAELDRLRREREETERALRMAKHVCEQLCAIGRWRQKGNTMTDEWLRMEREALEGAGRIALGLWRGPDAKEQGDG